MDGDNLMAVDGDSPAVLAENIHGQSQPDGRSWGHHHRILPPTPHPPISAPDLQTVRTALAVIGKGCLSASFNCVFLYTTELYPPPIR